MYDVGLIKILHLKNTVRYCYELFGYNLLRSSCLFCHLRELLDSVLSLDVCITFALNQ